MSEECFLEPECGEECKTVQEEKCKTVQEQQCRNVEEQVCDVVQVRVFGSQTLETSHKEGTNNSIIF